MSKDLNPKAPLPEPKHPKHPVGGREPLATPDIEHRGQGWVQQGVTNVNIDPDAVLDPEDASTVEDPKRTNRKHSA